MHTPTLVYMSIQTPTINRLSINHPKAKSVDLSKGRGYAFIYMERLEISQG